MRRYRLRSCMAVLTAGFLLCLAGPRCTIKKPVSPSWDVRFELPLVDEKYSMRDLDEDSESISIDSARKEVLLEIDEQTKPFPVGNYLVTRAAWNVTALEFTGQGSLGSQKTIDDTLLLRSDIIIEEAVFDSGEVVFTVDNQTGFSLDLRGEIPSLASDDPFVPYDNRLPRFAMNNIPPGQTSIRVNLMNARFTPIPSGDANLIPYQGTITLRSGSAGSGNRISVRVDLSRVKYKRITGWLNRTRIAIKDSVDTGIKGQDKFKAVELQSALMTLDLENDVRFPASFNVAVRGADEHQASEAVSFAGSVGASSSTTVGPLEVAPLLNLWPSRLALDGEVLLGDGTVKAQVSNTDSVRARVRIRVPLIFSLLDTTFEAKVDTIEMKEKARERLRKDLKTVRLVLLIENHLPLGFTLETFFSKTLSGPSIYAAATGVVRDTLDLPAAAVSGSPGTVGEPIFSREMKIGLTKDDIDIFDAERVFWGMRFTFPGTVGRVKVMPDDYIRLLCRIEADVRADFEDNGEGDGT
jgi:hypothetical protein